MSDERIRKAVQETFDFRPAQLIRYYNLLRPIYKNTARYGHVGVDRPEVTWERTEKVEALRRAAGMKGKTRVAQKKRKPSRR